MQVPFIVPLNTLGFPKYYLFSLFSLKTDAGPFHSPLKYSLFCLKIGAVTSFAITQRNDIGNLGYHSDPEVIY